MHADAMTVQWVTLNSMLQSLPSNCQSFIILFIRDKLPIIGPLQGRENKEDPHCYGFGEYCLVCFDWLQGHVCGVTVLL